MLLTCEGPADAGTSGRAQRESGATSRFYHDRPDPSKEATRRRCIRLGLRRKELLALAAYRATHGVLFPDPISAVVVLADALLVSRPRSTDFASVRRVAEASGIPASVDQISSAYILAEERLAERRRPLTDRQAGQLVDLRKDERRELGITTMRAVDETKAEREAWAKDCRRRTQRECSARRRAAAGATPRDQSFARTRPWEAEGISERTWRWRRQKARGAAGHCRDSSTHTP